MAQNKVTLSGKVIDQHGTPIAQATIAVENTTSGTYTDDRGEVFHRRRTVRPVKPGKTNLYPFPVPFPFPFPGRVP